MSVLMIMLLVLLFTTPVAVNASIVGQTYTFQAEWQTDTVQQDGGVIYQAAVNGQFTITVINTTEVGGDDAYIFNYRGFRLMGGAKYYTDQNDTVTFINQKVAFTATIYDADMDNRSELVVFQTTPQSSTSHPGREYFVNPIWSTHETDWNNAVDMLEHNSLAKNIVTSADAGTFQVKFDVPAEFNHPEFGAMNGTTSFSFSASYDDDGVLLNLKKVQTQTMQNENHSMSITIETQITRATGALPAAGGINLTTPLLYIGVAAIGGLAVGMIMGKRYL